MIQLDLADHRPLYEQIKEKFRRLILSGIMVEHQKMPSVRELSSVLTINPNTIQHAYKELEAEGYIYSQKAKGSFVAPRSHLAAKTDNAELIEQFAEIVNNAAFIGISEETLIDEVKKHYRKGRTI